MARGGCLCGGVRYQVNGSLRDVIVCHCSRCRRTHGHVGAYASCDESDLVLVSSSSLRWYEADERRRGFCSDCGASLFWQANGHKTISIAAGTLEPPTGLRTVAQIFAGEPGDYYQALGEGVIHEHGSQPDGTASSQTEHGNGDPDPAWHNGTARVGDHEPGPRRWRG